MEKSLSFQARREVLHQMAPQYREASPSQKRTLLDAFVAATGYDRKYAMWLLNHAEEVLQTLSVHVLAGTDLKSNTRCSWYGTPPTASAPNASSLFFPRLIEALERHEHLQLTEECRSQLLSMSAATADRLLRSQRKLG